MNKMSIVLAGVAASLLVGCGSTPNECSSSASVKNHKDQLTEISKGKINLDFAKEYFEMTDFDLNKVVTVNKTDNVVTCAASDTLTFKMTKELVKPEFKKGDIFGSIALMQVQTTYNAFKKALGVEKVGDVGTFEIETKYTNTVTDDGTQLFKLIK